MDEFDRGVNYATAVCLDWPRPMPRSGHATSVTDSVCRSAGISTAASNASLRSAA